MNTEKYTLSASARLQEAQEIAQSAGNPSLESIHLLSAIANAPESINRELLGRFGVDMDSFSKRIAEQLQKLPKATGQS